MLVWNLITTYITQMVLVICIPVIAVLLTSILLDEGVDFLYGFTTVHRDKAVLIVLLIVLCQII